MGKGIQSQVGQVRRPFGEGRGYGRGPPGCQVGGQGRMLGHAGGASRSSTWATEEGAKNETKQRERGRGTF